MPSPFPGMNPYLEQDDVWHDFHKHCVPCLAAALVRLLSGRYVVRLTDNVYVHDIPTDSETVATPTYPVDIEHLSSIEIQDCGGRQRITVIELLGPPNKETGRNREQYLRKRNQLLLSSAHLVEIDLRRGGQRMSLAGSLPRCDYCVMISKVEKRPRIAVWPIQLRDPLPAVPIPLRKPDPDVRIDLQAVLHRVYDEAGYGDYIYRGAPRPALSAADAEWARGVVAGAS